MTRTRRTLLIAGLLLLAAALAGVAEPRFARSAATPAGRTITVTGTGSVVSVPDRASFSFGVDTRGATAAAALASNAAAARAMIAALKAAGVAAADLQTTQVSLSPQTSQDGTTIVGFAASSSVSATAALAKAGATVDAAVGAGATSVSGPVLSTADQASLEKQALAKAVADAKDKADALAAAAGLRLGAVRTIVEGSAAAPLPWAAAKGAAVPADVPVEPGTQETDATVTVTYDAS